MWLIPFSPGLDHVVRIHFDRAQSIAGLRLWNYNKSPEDTYRGVSWAERSPLSGRQHDEWLVWVQERSINPPEPSKWGWGGDIQGENKLCFLLHTADLAHSPGQPGELQGGLASSVTVGPLPTQSRLYCRLWACCPLSTGEGAVRQACVPSSSHQVPTLPPLSAPPLRVLRKAGKGLPLSWELHS